MPKILGLFAASFRGSEINDRQQLLTNWFGARRWAEKSLLKYSDHSVRDRWKETHVNTRRRYLNEPLKWMDAVSFNYTFGCPYRLRGFLVPALKTSIRQRRVFSAAGHATWNRLSLALRLVLRGSHTTFYSNLQTALFNRGWVRSAPEYMTLKGRWIDPIMNEWMNEHACIQIIWRRMRDCNREAWIGR